MFDDDAPKPKKEYVLGQPLETMSLDELATTIERLRAEIDRIEAAKKSKSGALSAAESLFRKK
jgi:uncharacterized small protein (DUF1192 family)